MGFGLFPIIHTEHDGFDRVGFFSFVAKNHGRDDGSLNRPSFTQVLGYAWLEAAEYDTIR